MTALTVSTATTRSRVIVYLQFPELLHLKTEDFLYLGEVQVSRQDSKTALSLDITTRSYQKPARVLRTLLGEESYRTFVERRDYNLQQYCATGDPSFQQPWTLEVPDDIYAHMKRMIQTDANTGA